jgi:Tfp pilus assembly protein PilV
MLRKLGKRLASESGMGLIELMISLTVLVVGIGGTMSLMAGSFVTLQHASKEGTAITIADRQLEAYRSMPYGCVSSSFAVPPGCVTYTGFPNPYAASQTTTSAESPDHHLYDVTTSIAAATGSGSQIKVTVSQHGSSTVLAQEASYFSSAGQSANG